MKFKDILHARKEQKWKGSIYDEKAEIALRQPLHEEETRPVLGWRFPEGDVMCEPCIAVLSPDPDFHMDDAEMVYDPRSLEGERCVEGCEKVFNGSRWARDSWS